MAREKSAEFKENLTKIALGNIDVFRQTTDEFLKEVNSNADDSSTESSSEDVAAAAAQ